MVNVTIKSRKDTLSNWQTSNPVLSDGEVAVVEIPATDSTPAICLIKIGDGKTNFNTLQYMQSPAADVYAWAKKATKPEYDYSEIKNLTTMIVAGNNITATTKDNKVTIATTQNVAKIPGTLPDIGDIEALPVWNSDEGWKRIDADALKATANTIVKRNASGQIVTAAPTANNHAANKKYVDDQTSKIGTTTNKNNLTAVEYLSEADIPSTPEVGKEYAITDLISYSDLDAELQTKLDSSNNIVPKAGTVQLEITPKATQDISWESIVGQGTQVATIKIVKTSDGKLQVNITGSYYTSLGDGINEDFIIGTIPVVAGKTYTLPEIDTAALDEDDNRGGYKWKTANPFVATTTGTQNLIMHVYFAANEIAKEVSGMKPIASTVSYTLADKGLLQKTDDGYVFAEAGNGIAIGDGDVSVDDTVATIGSLANILGDYIPVKSNQGAGIKWDKVQVLATSDKANTVVKRTSTGQAIVADPTEDRHAATKRYVDAQTTKIGTKTNKSKLSSIEYLGEADIPSTPEAGKEYAVTDFISYSDLDSDLQGKLDSTVTKAYVDAAVSNKQDALTAGAGISIENDTIAVTKNVATIATLPELPADVIPYYKGDLATWSNKEMSVGSRGNTIALRTARGTLTVAAPTYTTDAATKGYVDAAVAGAGGGSSKQLLRFDGNTFAYFDNVATSAYQYTFHLRGVTAMDTGNVEIKVGQTTLFSLTPGSSNEIHVDGTLMCYPESSLSSNTQHYITYSYTASDGTCKSGYTGPSTDMRVTFKGIIGAPASGIYTNWVIREQISCANWEGLSSDEVVDDTETI